MSVNSSHNQPTPAPCPVFRYRRFAAPSRRHACARAATSLIPGFNVSHLPRERWKPCPRRGFRPHDLAHGTARERLRVVVRGLRRARFGRGRGRPRRRQAGRNVGRRYRSDELQGSHVVHHSKFEQPMSHDCERGDRATSARSRRIAQSRSGQSAADSRPVC